jgi:hypothetical protein
MNKTKKLTMKFRELPMYMKFGIVGGWCQLIHYVVDWAMAL